MSQERLLPSLEKTMKETCREAVRLIEQLHAAGVGNQFATLVERSDYVGVVKLIREYLLIKDSKLVTRVVDPRIQQAIGLLDDAGISYSIERDGFVPRGHTAVGLYEAKLAMDVIFMGLARSRRKIHDLIEWVDTWDRELS